MSITWDNVITPTLNTPTLNTPTVITPTIITPTVITPTLNDKEYLKLLNRLYLHNLIWVSLRFP